MGGKITNCPACDAIMYTGSKCTQCHPEELERAIRQTAPTPKVDSMPPMPKMKPTSKRDEKMIEYLIASVPSVAAVAHYLISQMRYDVYVRNVVVLESDDGDILIRKTHGTEWGRVEVKQHPTYSWEKLSGMPALIVDTADNYDKHNEPPVAVFVFANDLKRAFVCHVRDKTNHLFKRMMPDPNWQTSDNPNRQREVYMLPRKFWIETNIQGDDE